MSLVAVTASHAKEAAPYRASVESRGATTRLVVPDDFAGVTKAVEGVSGLLLCGGADVHPKYYGQEIDPEAGVETWAGRDEMELALLRHALERDMPVLAICRGMQVLNVAFGGSLIQHIPGHGPGNIDKDQAIEATVHQVYVSPGSRLGAIIGLGAVYRTNSWHHQGLREQHRAPGLLASAYHPQDGIIEGLESIQHDWVIGVQCHPEREAEVPKNFLRLFDGFIERAERFSPVTTKARS
jgi:putative glutamine amidotransferase